MELNVMPMLAELATVVSGQTRTTIVLKPTLRGSWISSRRVIGVHRQSPRVIRDNAADARRLRATQHHDNPTTGRSALIFAFKEPEVPPFNPEVLVDGLLLCKSAVS